MKKGDEDDQDVSSNSKFMLGIMDDIGNSTQSTYYSIEVVYEKIIYMMMDNMWGNRKNESRLEYSEYLAENYNIVVNHQVSQYPKTNMIRTSQVIPSSFLELWMI